MDLLFGAGENNDRAATTSAVIRYADTSIHPSVDESSILTFRVREQTAASAEFTATLYCARGV